jgi:hypothetical protein
MMKKIMGVPFHPFMLSAYAVLGVYATNANEIPIAQIWRPVSVSILFAALILIFFILKTRELGRAGFLATLTVLGFFYFGHLFFFISYFPLLSGIPGKLYLTSLAWVVLLIGLGHRKVWIQFKNPLTVTRALNIIGLLVIVFPLATTVFVALETKTQDEAINSYMSGLDNPILASKTRPPDIYYIILDGYGRNDVLEDLYGVENNSLLEFLSQKNFYVADQASSNYMQTELSLASALNFQYLDFLTAGMGNSQNRGPLNTLIHNSLVRRMLSNIGYRFTALPSSVLFTQIRNADTYISVSGGAINELEGLIIAKTIPGAYIEDMGLNIPLPNYSTQRKTIVFTIETLKSMPDSEEPRFIFAHILAPHPPFVFDDMGNSTQPDRPYFIGDATGFLGDKEEYLSGYAQEVKFLNTQIAAVVEAILNNSKGNSIIIIHGDHGPGAFTSFTDPDKSCFRERFSILLAIYLPNQDYSKFQDDVSLVNLFPALFNTYYEADIKYLENRSYFASWMKPYKFIDVTDKLANECSNTAAEDDIKDGK